MRLIVHFSDSKLTDEVYDIGEGHEYKTWYWGTQPTMMGGDVANLIIKRTCHTGCRVEIPRERISSITVDTNSHVSGESIPVTVNETPQS